MNQIFRALVVAAVLFAAHAAGASQRPANLAYQYDFQTMQHALGRKPYAAVVTQAALPARRGMQSNFDARMGRATFVWADAKARPTLRTPMRREAMIEAEARDFLGHNALAMQLKRADIDRAILTSIHARKNGPSIARFRQEHAGLEVFGQRINVMLDKRMAPVAASGHFAPAPAPAVTGAVAARAPKPAVSAAVALAAAASDLGAKVSSSDFSALDVRSGYTRYSIGSDQSSAWRVKGSPRAKLGWVPAGDGLELAWKLSLRAQGPETGEQRSYGYIVSATDGRILVRKDFMADAVHSYRVWADTDAANTPFSTPFGEELHPWTGAVSGPFPRVPVDQNLITLDAGPISTGDPWLPDGATALSGNNVDVYLDLNGFNGFDPGEDFTPLPSSVNAFDYPYQPDTDPTTQAQLAGAATHFFYVLNWLHDDWYDNGFDEAAGNGQVSNLGRPGFENDPIIAEGQDGSGFNNANMSTPPDGERIGNSTA
jgi:hypothetical protein